MGEAWVDAAKTKRTILKNGIVPFVLFIVLKKVDERIIKFYTLI